MSEKVRVAIIDDHTLFRDGLSNLLKEYDNMEVVFTASSGSEMQEKLKRQIPPDVVLMDINMPHMNGFEATAWLRSNFPEIRVLALSMYEDDSSIIKMLKAGAGGYVLKECTAGELVRAIGTINDSGYYINDHVSGRLLHSLQDEERKPNQVILSEREKEFLKLCCSELTYKEIAQVMDVSPRTVDGYRDILFEKLELKSRTGLVLYAIKNQVVQL